MLRSIRSAPALGDRRAAAERMISGSWPNSWIETGPPSRSSRVDPQQLVERLAVAVVDREARDHLGDREPGAVALGLQAHEPVADAGQRREHDPVGDRDAAERPGVVQGAQRARGGLGLVALPDQPQAREREQVVDLVDRSQNGHDARRQPAGGDRRASPRRARRAGARRCRRPARRSRRSTPERIASTVDLPISARGGVEVDLRQRGARAR